MDCTHSAALQYHVSFHYPELEAFLCAPVMLRGFQHFASKNNNKKNKTVISLEVCCIHALSDRPSGQNPSVF